MHSNVRQLIIEKSMIANEVKYKNWSKGGRMYMKCVSLNREVRGTYSMLMQEMKHKDSQSFAFQVQNYTYEY